MEEVKVTKKGRKPKAVVEQVAVPTPSRLRDENGLIKNLEHKFDENGFVNWRAMIPKKHIVLNRNSAAKDGINLDLITEEEKQKYIEDWPDEKKVVKLAGFREVARLRGYSSLHTSITREGDRVVCHCVINWIPNFETGEYGFVHTGVAGAGVDNVGDPVYVKFLEAIASNRAFCRAVRESLNIHVVSDEELDTSERVEIAKTSGGPKMILQNRCAEKGIGFEAVKTLLAGKGFEDENWISWETLSVGAAVAALDHFKKQES